MTNASGSTLSWMASFPPLLWAGEALQTTCIGALKQGKVPRHVAFVMDGNRRFARRNRMETAEGHNLGFESLARILEVCYKSGVEVVTIYAFSIENFKRSQFEVDALMDIAKIRLSQVCAHGDIMDRYGASLRILGQKSLVREDVLEAINRATQMTRNNKRAILNVCFPYTSQDEIASAIREIAVEAKRGDIDIESIDESTMGKHLFTQGCPPLDILIRTSGVRRLSDFMLWQCHQHTTIEFVDVLWPEFDVWHFLPILFNWSWKHIW